MMKSGRPLRNAANLWKPTKSTQIIYLFLVCFQKLHINNGSNDLLCYHCPLNMKTGTGGGGIIMDFALQD